MPPTEWEVLTLRSGHLACDVLPGKGAEIETLRHLPTGAQVLGRLRPTPPPDGTLGDRFPGADEGEFTRWYGGGWQGLLPNGDGPCTVDGVRHSFHGESWGRAWTVESATAAAATLTTDLAWPPLHVSRRIELPGDRAAIAIAERVENRGTADARILWGHHPVFGAPLLGPGSRIDLPPGDLETVRCDATSRFASATGLRWPPVGDVDASIVPPAAHGSHDLCLVTGFDTGRARLTSPDGSLSATLEFDAGLFRWLWIWQLFGGAEAEPFAGRHVLGIEPWTGPPGLDRAVRDGAALVLHPGEARETTITLTIDAEEAHRP